MDSITQAAVDAQLSKLTDPANAEKYSTRAGLMEFVNELPVTDPPGTAANARTFTYSGPGNGDIARMLAEDAGLNGRMMRCNAYASM